MNLGIIKTTKDLVGKSSAPTREIIEAEVVDVAKIVSKNSLETLNIHGFLKHIFDFLDSPPDTFNVSLVHGSRCLTKEDWQRPAENIPSFRESLEELFGQATNQIAYILLPARWPNRHTEFRVEGLACSSDLAIAILPEDHCWHKENTLHDMVSIAMHFIRGAFNYGEFGVFTLAIPVRELGNYFEFFSDWHLRSKDKIHIPAKYIVDLIDCPSDRDKRLLEVVIRSYWHKLKKLGFGVASKYDSASPRQDPLHDEIPRVLKNGNVEVGLGDEWRAKGTLEVMHRIYIINEIIKANKLPARPQIDVPALSLKASTGLICT